MWQFNKFIKILNQNDLYLVGVSGGVDSMVLLDLLKSKLNLVVCHVNYNLRKESKQETKLVKKYCLKYDINLEVLEIKNPITTNIQEKTRTIRNNFFLTMQEKYHAKGIFLGHHKNDLLETYFMQQKRKGIVKFYGIRKISHIKFLAIYRPLLSYWKLQLYNYANHNQVPYLEDSSNFTNKYLRTWVRHNIIAKMSWWDKTKMFYEIKKNNWKNKHLFRKVDIIFNRYIIDNKINYELFKVANKQLLFMVIYSYLESNKYPIKKINKKIIYEIIAFAQKTTKNQATINLVADYKWVKNYCQYYIINKEL